MPVIEVEHLARSYGPSSAVRDVSLAVEQGEIFGVLGPNGAGRTTTVECLQGLRAPDAGRLRVLGLDPQRQRGERRRRVGSQLQESALPDRMRVWEALDLFSSLASGGGAEWRSIASAWGLGGLERPAFSKLSGGERQRLLVALALVNGPEVVFLDELTQGLDPAARRVAWSLVRQARDRGATVVMVTHFMEEGSRAVRPGGDHRRWSGRRHRYAGRAGVEMSPARPGALQRSRGSRRVLAPGRHERGPGGEQRPVGAGRGDRGRARHRRCCPRRSGHRPRRPASRATEPRGRLQGADRSTERWATAVRALAKLSLVELKLYAREPVALVFTFGFPLIVLVSLIGTFAPDDPAFRGARPADYYLASYVGVVIGAVALIALPVRLASYRERGVLRRFQASSVPALAVVGAQVVVGLVMAVLGGLILVVAGMTIYGARLPSSLPLAAGAFVLSAVSLLAIGSLLGSLARSASSAQAVGLIVFFPMWLVSGAGPPPAVMGPQMRAVADGLPPTYAVLALQQPWLGSGSAVADLVALCGIALVAGALAAWALLRSA